MAKIAFISLYEINYLGARVLASYLLKHKHSVHNILFKDFIWETRATPLENHIGYQTLHNLNISTVRYDAEPWTKNEVNLLKARLKELNPDIIGIGCRSPLAPFVKFLVEPVKDACPTSLLIAGGFGPTLEPRRFLDFGFDLVIRGDGEESLLELAKRIDTCQTWEDIFNLAYIRDGHLQLNSLLDQRKDLGDYPPPLHGDEYCSFIEHDTLHKECDPLKLTANALARKGLYSTYITRGCINTCSYCSGGFWSELYKADGAKSYKSRKRDLNQVLDELGRLDKDTFSYVRFVDECNTLTNDEIKYFFSRYKETVALPFTIYMDYKKVLDHPELINFMIDCGWDSTGVGVQTGSEGFASHYYTRKNKNQIYKDYITLLFDNYITTNIQLIQGNPYEEDSDFCETLDFIKSLPFDPLDQQRISLVIFRLKAFPQAPLIEIAPRVVSDPMPANEWWRRALLMNLRQYATDEQMEFALAHPDFKRMPTLLKKYAETLLYNLQKKLVDDKIAQLSSRNLFFYGAGNALKLNWRYFKHMGITPNSILLDSAYVNKKSKDFDGIPIHSPEDVREQLMEADIVIFSKNSGAIYRPLINNFGVDPKRIFACVPSRSLEV